MNIAEELGVQSYCFRAFEDHPAVIEQIHKSGLAVVELCGEHGEFSDLDTMGRVVDLYKDAGIRVPSITAQLPLSADEQATRATFEFAARAGVGHIMVDFDVHTLPECFRVAEKLADEYDVLLGIHNHGGSHWLGNEDMLAHVFANTSPRIGLCLDTAWAIDASNDPVAMARRFADRLYGLHVKDYVFDRAGVPEDVVVGQGNLDLAGLLAVMAETNKCKYAVLEYEGDEHNPTPAIKQCVEAVQELSNRG